MSLSKRFIGAYNLVDNALRQRFGFSDRMTYSDVVRKSAEQTAYVRKHEDELISYGRLRNAIVHDSTESFVIAEPHESVVANFEAIAKVVSTPPRVMEEFDKASPCYIGKNESMESAVKLMHARGFANIPVWEGNTLFGLITEKQIVFTLGECLKKGIDVETAMKEIKVGEILTPTDINKIYSILSANDTLDKVLDAFEKNRRLSAVLITESGKASGKLLRIFTVPDVLKIAQILEDF